MNQTETIVMPLLQAPTPESLWQMRAVLVEAGLSPDRPTSAVLTRFHHFLSNVKANMTDEAFSELASYLDVAAVGTVALQHLLLQDPSSPAFWKGLGLGILSEGLMVMASRQYIKGAQAELVSVVEQGAWDAYQGLWQLSVERQPALEPAARRQHLEQLLAPVHEPKLESVLKTALIGRIFQSLLLLRLAQEDIFPLAERQADA